MSLRTPLPEALADREFSVSLARSMGVPRGRLSALDLSAPFHGVRSPADRNDLASRLRAYAQRMPPDRVISHVTAARLWGLPIPLRLAEREEIDVSGVDPGGIARGRGVIGHRLDLDQRDVVVREGIRLTSQCRTVCDLSSQLTTEELLAVADYVLWRRHPERDRVRAEHLAQAESRFCGRRGRPSLTRALSLACDRSDSPPESIFRYRIVTAGFPPVVANQPVFDAEGRFVGMPDLGFPEFRVAFDYEGDIHRTDRNTWLKDLRRPGRFEDAGWSYIRAGAHDLRDDRDVLATLRRRLTARGWSA